MVGTGTGWGGDNQPHYRILQHSEYLLWDPGGGGACSPTHHFMWMQPVALFPVSGSGRRGDDRTNILEAREDIGLVYGSG